MNFSNPLSGFSFSDAANSATAFFSNGLNLVASAPSYAAANVVPAAQYALAGLAFTQLSSDFARAIASQVPDSIKNNAYAKRAANLAFLATEAGVAFGTFSTVAALRGDVVSRTNLLWLSLFTIAAREVATRAYKAWTAAPKASGAAKSAS